MEPVTELIFPDMTAKTFAANGKTFRIASSLGTHRYEVMERFEIEFGFGVSFKEMFDAWVDQYNCLQKQKNADAAVNAYKVINGMTNVDNMQVYAFKLCTLFMNYEDEDIRYYDEDIAAQKEKDWQDGAIDSRFFFQQAALSVKEFVNVYKRLALDISAVLNNEESQPQPE